MMKQVFKNLSLGLGCAAVMSTAIAGRASAGTLDLTPTGLQSGTLNGALFEEVKTDEPAGTGVIKSFVRLQSPGNSTTEKGYNTDGTPLQFDELGGHTRSLLLNQVPIVTRNGIDYRQFLLDINEPNATKQDPQKPLIALEQLQLFLGNAGNLLNYPTFGNNATKIFDLDSNDVTNRVAMSDTNAGSGRFDLFVYIPNSLFTGSNQYVYLYSEFSGAEGGFEEWAVKSPKETPKPVPEPAAIAGLGLVAGAMTMAKRRKLNKAV